MALADLLGVVSKLQLVQGVEKDLRDRRRAGLATIIGTAVVQLVLALSTNDYLSKLGHFFANLITGNWNALFGGAQGLDGYEVIGLLVLVVGVVSFLLFRNTRFFGRESEEPFRYTFSVDPFEPVSVATTEAMTANSPPKEPQLALAMLHHDLIEKLTANIGRLSLLDITSIGEGVKLDSHIQIRGQYALRHHAEEKHALQVMVRIRIGDKSQPEEVSPRVDVLWAESDVDATYNRVLEQAYSRVATAIYKQIRMDIQKKIELFPSRYLRAVGLFNEAEDFEKSNTVDSYDCAIELYRDSLRYFDTRRTDGIADWMVMCRGLWRIVRRAQLVEAKARISFARCLIYRNIVSALSGRTQNPLFHVPGDVEYAVGYLEMLYHRNIVSALSGKIRNPLFHVPGDVEYGVGYHKALYRHSCDRISELRSELRNVRRSTSAEKKKNPTGDETAPGLYLTYPVSTRALRGELVFEQHRKALFEALTVWSLASSKAGARVIATEKLGQAKRVAPDLAESSALYMLAEAEVVPSLNEKYQRVRSASDRKPSFEIALYCFAECLDQQFRMRNEITPERAGPVLKAFRDVQELNPGNIGAYAAYGHLQWLLGNNEEAEKAYRNGLDVKAIRRHTFVGNLNYGLARIAAENGRFNESYDLYRQASTADPCVGAFGDIEWGQSLNLYYTYFVDSMLERYRKFSADVSKFAPDLSDAVSDATGKLRDTAEKPLTRRTLGAVLSWVQNDHGNACFQYYMRTGIASCLDEALEQYHAATKSYPENAVVYFNLSMALGWKQGEEHGQERLDYLEKAEQLEPGWIPLTTQSLELIQSDTAKAIRDKLDEKAILERDLKKLDDKLENIESFTIAKTAALENVRGDLEKLDRKIAPVHERIDEPSQPAGASEHAEREKLSKDRDSKRGKLKEVKKVVNDLYAIQNERLQPRLQKLIRRTNLTAFFGCVTIKDLFEAVPIFLQQEVRNDRLDRASARTLRILAGVLVADSFGEKPDRKDGERAIDLCRYLLSKFYPENFDLGLSLRDLYMQSGKTKGAIEAIRIIRSVIMYSVENDPTHWNILQWAQIYFDIDIPTPRPEDCLENFDSVATKLKDRQEFVVVPDALRDVFGLHGIELGNARVKKTVAEETWEVSDRSDRSVYRVTRHSDGKSIQIAFDNGRRYERFLENAIADRQDIRDVRKFAFLHGLLGSFYSTKLRYREAAKCYRRALENAPEDPIVFFNLALAEEEGEAPDSWRRAFDALEQACRLAPTERAYQRRLVALRKKLESADRIGFYNLDKFRVVPPIAVEVAGDLIPLVNAEGSDLTESFANMLAALRKEFAVSFGVRIPEILVRGNETNLPNGIYIIMINEIPLVSGTIRPNMVLVAGTPEHLEVAPDKCEETTRLDTGESMCWLSESQAEHLREPPENSKAEPIQYIGWHLRAVLRKNLCAFFGYQETQNLVEEYGPRLTGRELDSASTGGLTTVLSILLEEETPIASFEAIRNRYLVGASESESLEEAVAAMRRLPEISGQLRGAEKACTFYGLSDAIESKIEGGLLREGDAVLLALEPEPMQEILTAVRMRPRKDIPGAPEAIVVRESSIRRAVRKLVELEFPHLWVMAEVELDEAASARERLPIELET